MSSDPIEGAVLPTSPGQATFTFDEPVSLSPGGVKVFDAEGRPVSSSASAGDKVIAVDLPDDLPVGTYVVAWRIVSADGHPVAGSLSFSVGTPSIRVVAPDLPDQSGAAITTALSTANAMTYIGLLLVVGLGIFTIFLLPGEARADRPRRRMRTLTTVCGVGSLAAAAISVPLTVVNQQGLRLADVLSVEAWTGTSITALVALGVLALGITLVRGGLAMRLARAQQRAAVGLGTCCAALSPAMSGHSRAYAPQAAVIAIDVLHVLAGGVWLGGLVGLAITLPAIAGRGAHAARTLARFSTLASGVLAALVATGGLLAWRIVGSWENLFGTRYGWMLLSKIALVSVACALAGWNRYVLLPRTRPTDGYQERQAAARQLRRVVTVEASVIVLVLGLTGFLVNQAPRVGAVVIPDGRTGVQATRLGDDLKVLATLTPAVVGQNTLLVQIQDLAGDPVEPGRFPEVSLRSDGLDLGKVRATSDGVGTFRGDVVLPAAGPWRLQVSVRLGEFENPVAVVTFNVTD